MNSVYFLSLVASFIGMLLIDWRWKVAFFRDFWQSALVVGCTFVGLVIFDITGLHLDIFSVGERVIGVFIFSPDFPVEEAMLLLFFGYFSLIILRLHR